MKNTIILLIFLFFSVQNVSSLTTAKFNHIWVEQDLPSRTVWTMLQDEKGALWIGTTSGLAKYDGYTFELIKDKASSRYITNSIIRELTEDNQKNLWLGTQYNGLFRYNKTSGKFSHFPINPNIDKDISSDAIRSLAIDQDSIVWFGTKNGLTKLNPNDNKYTYFKHNSQMLNGIPNNFVKSLLIASDNTLWIGTNKGIAILNRTSEKIDNVLFKDKEEPIIYKIFESKNKNILAGTSNGIYLYDKTVNKFIRYSTPLVGRKIISIVEDNNKHIWVGTFGDGLYKIYNNLQVEHFEYDKGNPYSIGDSSIPSLVIDQSNVLWVGTFDSGLDWLPLNSSQFEFYDNSKNSLTCLPTPVIYSVHAENANRYWLATKMGLVKVELNKGICSLLTHKNNSNSLTSNKISFLYQNKNMNMLIGTLEGTNAYILNEKKFHNMLNDYPKLATYDYLETNNDLYIATSKGLYKKNFFSKELLQIKSKEKKLGSSYISQVEKNSTGKIWLATHNGLLTIDSDFNIIRPNLYMNVELNPKKPINAIHIDKKDQLWAGFDGQGLFVFNKDGSLVHSISDESSLKAIRGFSSILESKDGNIWISSIEGLERLNPKTWEIDAFTEMDGLQSRVFTRGAAFYDGKGYMYFGGRKGLTRFKPNEIKTNNIKPEVGLTEFIYFNQVLKPRDTNQKYSLNKPISEIQDLHLSYKDYNFGFEFSAHHYADPKRNQYAYMMEGWDKDWTYTTAKNRRASYNNLPAGDYVFKVKASNNHGLWNDKPAQIKIHITPPPWATILAYSLYVIIFIFSIYSFIKYRTKSLEKRSIILENSVTKRTEELAQEKSKVEQLLSKKNEEFANVSHEFRTPLTLILGPTEQLLKDQTKTPTAKLQVIQRNANRLLRMVDQLLNMENFRVKSLTQKGIQVSHKAIRLIAEAFKDIAAEKNIKLEIIHLEPIDLMMVPDSLEKIVLNIVSNAIKYSSNGDLITVATYKTDSNQLHIQIIDTGIGIAENEVSRIFDRFYRILDQKSEQITGAGIGLALVKELVKTHQGTIEISSQLDVGTEVNIYIPIVLQSSDNINKKTEISNNQEIIQQELLSLDNKNTTINKAEYESNENGIIEILVVEDNPDMQNYIAECLTVNYNVKVASNGEEGLRLALNNIPDIIISDIMMPKMDGYELTKAIRTNNRTNHIPIILLTAKNDRDSRIKGWQEKADEYLTKPFDVNEILIRINNLLEIRDLLRKQFSQKLFSEFVEPHKSKKQDANLQQQMAFLKKLDDLLLILHKNNELKLSAVAAPLAMSERQLFRKLKAITDMSTSEYLRRFRLQQATRLLSENIASNIVALETGFSSQSYFSRCFKVQYGCVPSEYFEKNNNTDNINNNK